MVQTGSIRGGGTLTAMEPLDSPSPDSEPRFQPSRRWPLGLLTILVVAVIAGGVWILGGDDDSTTPEVPDLATDLGVGIQTGNAAPDFAVDLIGGGSFRLSDHLGDDGRPVILNLWASWCSPCRAEMPAFDTASQTHTDVFFLGVAVEDDPAAATAFAEEIGVSYALAIDEAERVGRRYPSPGLPATFFISTDGEILRTIFGQVDEAAIADLIEELFSL